LLLIGFVSGFIIVILMIIGFAVFYKYFSNAKIVVDAVASMGIQKNFTLIVAIVGLVFNAFAEEVFWRGTLHLILGLESENKNKQQLSREKLLSKYVLYRILIIAILFGLNHVGIMAGIAPSVSAGLLSLLGITLSGILWGVMRETTRSILPSLISHILVTLGYSGLLVYYFMLG
ncbi:MAG TPA: CPBP family intramembrane metalloprotease, partial [Spirochaetales bacterium]|nr:CPBP family intramembrane metalloprotease [Spirochaetales bacterium]